MVAEKLKSVRKRMDKHLCKETDLLPVVWRDFVGFFLTVRGWGRAERGAAACGAVLDVAMLWEEWSTACGACAGAPLLPS